MPSYSLIFEKKKKKENEEDGKRQETVYSAEYF
jgi:hypothetical protein